MRHTFLFYSLYSLGSQTYRHPRRIRWRWSQRIGRTVRTLTPLPFPLDSKLKPIGSLWKVQPAVNTINQTYELDATLEIWNYRAHIFLSELAEQTSKFACAGGVWTQTTDVEGEVNGLVTYDRRLVRMNEKMWKRDIQALYDAAADRNEGKKVGVMEGIAGWDGVQMAGAGD
jgi:hypothetical protein